MTPETRYARSGDVNIAYQVVGDAARDLVLVPGWVSNIEVLWASGVPALGLAVRAGLHTGEVELRHDKVSGLAVHIGARVAAAAGPGEVLVSSTVRDLVAGSGLRFQDRGLQTLKGVPGDWHLFALEAEGRRE